MWESAHLAVTEHKPPVRFLAYPTCRLPAWSGLPLASVSLDLRVWESALDFSGETPQIVNLHKCMNVFTSNVLIYYRIIKVSWHLKQAREELAAWPSPWYVPGKIPILGVSFQNQQSCWRIGNAEKLFYCSVFLNIFPSKTSSGKKSIILLTWLRNISTIATSMEKEPSHDVELLFVCFLHIHAIEIKTVFTILEALPTVIKCITIILW